MMRLQAAAVVLLVIALSGCASPPEMADAEGAPEEGLQLTGQEVEVYCKMYGTISGKWSGDTYFEDQLTVGDPGLIGPTVRLGPVTKDVPIDFENPDLGRFQKGVGTVDLRMLLRYRPVEGQMPPPDEVAVTAHLTVRGRMRLVHGWFFQDTGVSDFEVELDLGDEKLLELDPEPFHTTELIVPYRPEDTQFFLGKITISMRSVVRVELRFYHLPSLEDLEAESAAVEPIPRPDPAPGPEIEGPHER